MIKNDIWKNVEYLHLHKKVQVNKKKVFFATSNKDYALRAHAALQLNQDIYHNFQAYKVA